MNSIATKINGMVRYDIVRGDMTLLYYLREVLNLKGAKEGCGAGDCGSCTVLLDGKPVNACLVLAAETDGHDVVTIEGLSKDGELTDLQQAFIEYGAVQCGYCSPGMILTAEGLLAENPNPTANDVRRALAGNLCRCTGYDSIVSAIIHIAGKRRLTKEETT